MNQYIFVFSTVAWAMAATPAPPALPPIPMPGTAQVAPAASAVPTPISSGEISSSSLAEKALPECGNPSTHQAKADSLFALGRWNEAQSAYESLCPCLPRKSRTNCLLQAVRALAQDPNRLSEAVARIDSLSLTTEPEDAGFGELMLTQANLYLQTGETMRALKAWKLARQVALPGQDPYLKALCTQIRQQFKDTTLAADCNKIPALAKQLAAGISSPAPRQSSATTASSPSAASPPTSEPNLATSPTAEGTWVLQFGAFSSKDNAELLLKNLKSRKIPTRLVTKNTAAKVLWLVQTEPFQDKESAQQYGKSALEPLGLDFQALPNP